MCVLPSSMSDSFHHVCFCVFPPFSSYVLQSDEKCEDWKAKNNIKKARLAPWWKAGMTMDEWERERRGVKGNERGPTRERPVSVIADIHSLCSWHGNRAEHLCRKQKHKGTNSESKSNSKSLCDHLFSPASSYFITVDSFFCSNKACKPRLIFLSNFRFTRHLHDCIPTGVKILIQDTSEWSNSIKPKALDKTGWSPKWEDGAVTQPWKLAESLVWNIMAPNDCLFPFCSIYQQQPAGKHIKHIYPQKTKYSCVLRN